MASQTHSEESIKDDISIKSQLRLPQSLKRAMRKKSMTQVSAKHHKKTEKKNTHFILQKSHALAHKPLQWMKIPLKKKNREDQVECSQICQICEEQIFSSSFLTISDKCSHRFCRDCLHTYAIMRISSFQSVVCPLQQCSEKINEKCKLFKELPQKIKKQFKQHKKFLSIKTDQRLCPFQYCEGLITISKKAKNQKIKIQCSQCQRSFCSLCLMKYHDNQCDKNSVLYYEASLHYRQCKQCKCIIERITGCDHIICKCGYEFCYQCGLRWSADHQCHKTPDCCFEVTVCWLFGKILYILAYLLIGYPIILFRSISVFLVIISSAVFVGLFAGLCIILQKLHKEDMCYFTLGLIFFPLLIVAGVFFVLIDMLAEVGPSIFSIDIVCGPCLTIARCCDEVKRRFYSQ